MKVIQIIYKEWSNNFKFLKAFHVWIQYSSNSLPHIDSSSNLQK